MARAGAVKGIRRDKAPAISPISGVARCQASDRPHRPMTMANHPGMRNLRGVAWWGIGVGAA